MSLFTPRIIVSFEWPNLMTPIAIIYSREAVRYVGDVILIF
jgi:hypothetical protein